MALLDEAREPVVHTMNCVVRQDSRILRANQGLSEFLGWAETELQHMPLSELIHPDDRAALETTLAHASRSPIIAQETRILTRTGDYRWLLASAAILDGNIQISAVDISARKRAELEDEKRLEWLEMAEQLAQVGYWRLDYTIDQVAWSEEVYRIHGLDPSVGGGPFGSR
ncbi:MAG: PAS domain S-box protein, partial [Myxococcota bacterium]